jgi:diaminopimelate decarboxylase
MRKVARLIERYFPSSTRELSIGCLKVSELAEHYGTPLYIYDAAAIDTKWDLLRQTLPPRFAISYSVKANPNQTILKHFLGKGAGLEVASAGEFCQALQAGCTPEKVIFAGPSKTEHELELVLKKGVGEIHLESMREAERVSAIAQRLNVRAPVALRVNPGGDAEGGAMRMGGRSTPFGIDEDILDEVLDRLLRMEALAFNGVHIFSGTQILDFTVLLSQYRKGIEIARRVAAHMSTPLRTLDFGGGLGIPYFPHEQELDMSQLKIEADALVEAIKDDRSLENTQFMVEPGRYLVGEAGIYVCRVNDIKISRDKKFLILDGGMHQHLAASGNLGQTIKRNYPIAILNKLDQPTQESVDVTGPLCTPLDVLGRGVELPTAEIGDLIGVFQSGAYARSASPLGFLSHPSPPEVWVDQRHHRLIRRRGKVGDYLRDQPADSPVALPGR